jgi:Tfp pilus assembly protein PilF
MQAIRLASLPPRQHADKLTESGNRFLHQGLILEAEREFQSALEIDGDNAGAHAGLAEVRERGGNATAARKEAQQSIAIAPNAPAYLVLARLDMAQNQLPSAAGNVSRALQLDRQSTEARDLRKQLESKGQNIP